MKNKEPNKIEDLIKQAKKLNSKLNNRLQHIVKANASSKIPFKLDSFINTLLHRIAHLSNRCYLLYSEKDALNAAILTRSLLETACLMFHAYKKAEEVIKQKNLGFIDTFLMNGLFGSKIRLTDAEAINVLTSIDHTDKKFQGIRREYETLCEASHPNCLGTFDLFGELDKNNRCLILGMQEEKNTTLLDIGLTNFTIAQEISISYYDRIISFLPELTEICNKSLSKQP